MILTTSLLDSASAELEKQKASETPTQAPEAIGSPEDSPNEDEEEGKDDTPSGEEDINEDDDSSSEETDDVDESQADPVVSFDDTLYKEVGYKKEELASILNEYKELKSKAVLVKDDKSRAIVEMIQEGKLQDLYSVLSNNNIVDSLLTKEINNQDDALEVLVAKEKLENPSFSISEIKMALIEKYGIPDKPEKSDFDETEDYDKAIEVWNKTLARKTPVMKLDAVKAKAVLSQFKTEFGIDKVSQGDGISETEIKNIRDNFFKSVDTDIKKFEGYKVNVKSREADIPVSFKIDDNEYHQIAENIKSKVFGERFDVNDFFVERWFDVASGAPKVDQIVSDIYLLEHKERVFSKIGNESASQAVKTYIKSKKSPQGATTSTRNQTTPPKNDIGSEAQALLKQIKFR